LKTKRRLRSVTELLLFFLGPPLLPLLLLLLLLPISLAPRARPFPWPA